MPLSEVHVKKLERPGSVEVTATHLPTGTTVTVTGANRLVAKRAAYAALARALGLLELVAEYEG